MGKRSWIHQRILNIIYMGFKTIIDLMKGNTFFLHNLWGMNPMQIFDSAGRLIPFYQLVTMAEQSESFSEQIQLHESEGDSGLQQTTLTVLVVSSSKKTHDIKE